MWLSHGPGDRVVMLIRLRRIVDPFNPRSYLSPNTVCNKKIRLVGETENYKLVEAWDGGKRDGGLVNHVV